MSDLWLGLFIGALAMFIFMLLILLWAVVRSYQLGLLEAHLPPDQRTIKVTTEKMTDRSATSEGSRRSISPSPFHSQPPRNSPENHKPKTEG